MMLTPLRVIVGMKDTRGTSEFVISPYFARSSFPLAVLKHFLIDSKSTDMFTAHVFIISIGSMLFSIMQVTNCNRVDGSLITSIEHACIIFAWHSIDPCWHMNLYASFVWTVCTKSNVALSQQELIVRHIFVFSYWQFGYTICVNLNSYNIIAAVQNYTS